MSAVLLRRSEADSRLSADIVDLVGQLARFSGGLLAGFPCRRPWRRSLCRLWRSGVTYAVISILSCVSNGLSFASFLRFCAVAASKNSSRAPDGPRSPSLPRWRMRLRWAKSISLFSADAGCVRIPASSRWHVLCPGYPRLHHAGSCGPAHSGSRWVLTGKPSSLSWRRGSDGSHPCPRPSAALARISMRSLSISPTLSAVTSATLSLRHRQHSMRHGA